MATAKEIAEQLRKKQTQSSFGSAKEIGSIIKNHNANELNSINNDYIKSYIDDVNTFFEGANSLYTGLNWNNSNDTYNNQKAQWEALEKRKNTIGVWLMQNQKSLDSDSYNSLVSSLKDISTSGADALKSFEDANALYSAFSSQGDYDKWYNQYKANEDEKNVVLNASDFEKYYDVAINAKRGSSIIASLVNGAPDIEYITLNGKKEGVQHSELLKQFNAYADEDEKKIYNYYLGKYGQDKASEYLLKVMEDINYGRATQRFTNLEGKTGKELLFGLEAGLDSFFSGLDNLFTSDKLPTTATQYTSGMVRDDLGYSGLQIGDKSLGQFGYDIINTTANQLPSIGTSMILNAIAPGAGFVVGGAMMGASAAGNAYKEMIDLGYTAEQARTYSTITGTLETVLGTALGGIAGIGKNLLGKVGVKALSEGINSAVLKSVLTWGSEILSEGLEEGLQEVLSPIVKYLATGDDFEGVDWREVGYSAILGGISAGMLNGTLGVATTAPKYINEAIGIKNNGNVDTLKSLASRFDAQTVAHKLGDKVTKDTNALQLSRLLYEVDGMLTEQNKREIRTALEEKGIIQRDARTISDYLAKAVDGETLTKAQQKAIAENPIIGEVFREVILDDGSSVNQRLLDRMALAEGAKTNAKTTATEKETTTVEAQPLAEETVKADTTEATAPTEDLTKVVEDRSKEAVINLLNSSDYDKASREMIANEYDGNYSVGEYLTAMRNGYEYGMSGIAFNDIPNDSLFARILSPSQQNTAYKLGVTKLNAITNRRTEAVEKGKKEGSSTVGRKRGTVKGSNVTLKQLKAKFNDQQNIAYKVLSNIASATGINIVLYESQVDANGRYTQSQGKFAWKNDTIYVDVNSGLLSNANVGDLGKYAMLRTFTHEFVHFFEKYNAEGYNTLRATVFAEMKKNGEDVDALIRLKQEEYGSNYDIASREVVAEALADMLTQSSFMEQLAQKNPSVLKSLIEKLKEFIADIKAYFKNIGENESREAKALKTEMNGTVAYLEDIVKLFDEVAVGAVENYQMQFEENATTKTSKELEVEQNLAEHSIGVDEELKEVHSLRYAFGRKDAEGNSLDVVKVGKKEFDVEGVAKLVQNVTGRSLEDCRDWVKAEISLANIVMTYPEFLDFEADNRYEAIKKNSDYPQGTVDLSNKCVKREEFTAMFDLLQKTYPNRVFTAQDIADMRNILREHKITVACGACFVEDRRQLLGEIADTYIGMWKTAVDSGKPLTKINAQGKPIKLGVTNDLAKKYGLKQGEDILATDKYIPTQYDLTTYEGFKVLQREHPLIAMGFERYNNSRGQQAGRLIEGRAEYDHQILGWSNDKVKKVNNSGGLRIFSFSDFEAVHLLDLVQIIIDCSARGVKIQGYTKVPAFAKLIRNTGIKLNRSLIPKGNTGIKVVNGKEVLDIDTTEGIDINDKDFMDEADNPNIGNILIGINPKQISIAMLDDFVDYIIPFHTNKSNAVCKKLGVGEWVNYKESQHEKDIATGKASAKNVNIYTEVINKYNPTNKVEFVNAFLEECRAQKKIPRYAEFLNKEYKADGIYSDEYGRFDYTYREGYHKFPIDFKMFDKQGNILLQENIVPNLDEGFMKEILDREVDRKKNYTFPEEVYNEIEQKFGKQYDQTVANDIIDEGDDGIEQFSLRHIIDKNGKDYGIGVYLDSELLSNLTEDERVELVKEYIKELGGQEFTAYDKNGKEFNVKIAEHKRTFVNNKGKRRFVNNDLSTKHILNRIKQESIVLVDELVLTSSYDSSTTALYPHGWVDNYGKNKWEYLISYVQDKNNSIWQLTLNIANSESGEKILYDINKIKAMGRSVDIGSVPTASGQTKNAQVDNSLPQNPDSVNTQNDKNLEQEQKRTPKELDADYMDAVNRGDMETAQKMVDEAAKEAGYKIKAYHGTNADFTVFDKKRVGKGIDQYGAGFYFASNPDVTEHYGTKRYDTYLKITKPINLITRPRGNGKTLNDVKLNQTQSYQILKRHPLMYDKENSPLGDFYEEYWEAGAKEWMIKDLAKKYNTVGELDGDVILYRDYPNELHEAIRDVVGYDGVQIYFETDSMVDERNDYYYVTWFNNQIKSADPIVYDDNGNVVPLSERFNSNNDDIRYQLRSSPLTDREVLSMAVERIDEEKLTTAEKNALDIFKKKLAKLNRIHSEREKQGSLYKEQQFGKDGDRKEAVKTLNRMKILDEQIKRATAELLSIKDKETLKNVLQNARKVVEVEQRAHDREVVARAKERQEITATKNKYKAIIRTDVDELVKWVTKPDNKAHKQVPDAVKNSVIAMLSSIDTSSDKLYKGQPTKATRKFLENTEKLKNALKTDFNAETAYSAYFDLPSDFMTRLDAFIEEGRKLAQASEGGFDVKSMNVEQLEQLAKIVRELKTWIKNINKFHDNAMFKFASDAGDNTIDTLAKMSDAGKHTGKAYKWFEFDQVRPSVVWERFGKGGKAIEQGFIDGQAKLAFNTKAVIDFRSKTYTEKEVKKWTNTINTVKLNGKTIEMPTSYLMGLYLLSKQKDSVRHLLGGGFRVGTFIREGKKYYDNEQHSFANEKQLNEFLDEYFSADKFAREREVADKIQKYMATTGAEWGNYVSVARFGEEKFTNPEYYPINSDGRLFEANTDEKPNNVDLYALLNMSFTKTRQEEANNKIIVYDMFDVFANHMSSMAQYNAFALPILNALKWLNYKQTELVGGKVATLDTVRDELARVYGTPEESGKGGGKTSYAETFIKNIIKAYNGTEVQGIATDELGMKGLRRHNMAQIAYNFRVVAQQPLSIIRAGTVLDMKNITKASGKILASINTTREEMLKHNGTAVWKNLGFYDINITRNMSEIIKGTQTTLDKIGEVGMKGAETMDILTWTTLWNACKLEVEQKQKITQADGELYWEKVNLLFNETIYKTQVVDTVLTKSEFMRSKGFFARAVSSFMSEPVTAYSTFVEAFDRYTRDIKSGYSKSEAWKRNGKHIGRTTAMYCLNAIMLSAVTAVIDSARDDDEYEEFGEKWAENFAENVIDELMPFNKLPIFSDLYDIAKELLSKVGVDTYGNPPQTLFAQWYDSLGKGVEILYDKISGEDTNYTYYGGIYKLLQAVSSMVGLPIAPLTRTVVTAWNSTVGELVPKYKIKSYDSGEFNSIKYAFKDGKLTEAEAIKELLSQGLIEDTTIGKNNEAYFIIREWEYGEGYSRYAKLYDSAINGNGNYSQALKELTSHGYDEKRIRTTLQTELSKRFKAGEVSKTTALTVLTKYCGKSRTEAEKLVYGWENA